MLNSAQTEDVFLVPLALSFLLLLVGRGGGSTLATTGCVYGEREIGCSITENIMIN